MSMLKRLEERKSEIMAAIALIESTAGGHNRKMSGGELSRRKELARNLKSIDLKIEAALAEDDLAQRVAEATPAGLFADF